MKRSILKFIVIILAFFMVFPIIFIIVGSFMSPDELKDYLAPILGNKLNFVNWPLLPQYPTLKSLVKLLLDSPDFFVMFWNSVFLVLVVLLGQALISTPAAWAFSQYNFSCKKILFTLYIAVMLMPFQVTMLSSYLVLDKFSMINTRLSLIVPGIFSTFPVFIMYRFFKNIPKSILESARIDGASEFKIFLKIGIPLGFPGIMSSMVLEFIEYWNLIEQPITFIKDQNKWPLSLYLPNVSLENVDMVFIASLVTLVTSLIVFFAGQKYLKEGISAVAEKE